MFRVTVDIFSGRPNPTWIVDNEAESREILGAMAKELPITAKQQPGFQELGYRGIHIDLLGDEVATDFGLPTSSFAITTGAQEESLSSGVNIAARLIQGMGRYTGITLPEHEVTPLNKQTQRLVMEQLREYEKNPPKPPVVAPQRWPRLRVTVQDDQCTNCKLELSRFNPTFWNSDAYVRANNNCYNYARNWKTNTFAQPGKAHKCYPYPMACADVQKAALCDGLLKRCTCAPDSEYPRRLMALVVWPGGDYHWYRKQQGNFWGHKPGSTPAKNTDNSGNVITEPKTANRGPYTDFCGYFYAGKSVVII